MSRNTSSPLARPAFRCVLLLVTGLLFVMLSLPAFAHGGKKDGFSKSFGRDFERTGNKLTQLAEAIPADQYGWRPAEGIRSVSESLMHVVSTVYHLTHSLGVEKPVDLPEDFESITAKDQVLAHLERATEQVHLAMEQNSDAQLNRMLPIFGREMPARDIFFLISGHQHEHLGQLIAYARSIGVVPPWSAARQPASDG